MDKVSRAIILGLRSAWLVSAFCLLSVSAHAACYEQSLVDSLQAAQVTAHSNLTRDGDRYLVSEVDQLPVDFMAGLSGNETSCPSNAPVGPASDTNVAANEVQEEQPPGALVGVTVFATDPDDIVTYRMANDGGGLITIHPNTGIMTTAASIDFETTPTLNVVAEAVGDEGGPNESVSQFPVTITVLNITEPTLTLVKLFETLSVIVGRVELAGGGTNDINIGNLSPPGAVAGTLSLDKKHVNGPVIFGPDVLMQTSEGTIFFQWWAEHHRETTFFSQEIDIAGNFVSPRFDFQYGGGNNPLGSAVWTTHLRRGTFDDENSTSRIHMACQWNWVSVSWKAGETAVMHYNGIRLNHEHPNTQGQELAAAILGVNAGVDELKSNGKWHLHHFLNDGHIREMVFSATKLTDQQIADIHALLYADEIAAGRHAPGDANAETPANFHGPGLPFTGADIPALQDPITDGDNVRCIPNPTDNVPKSIDDVTIPGT